MMAKTNKDYWEQRSAQKILDAEVLCQRHEGQMKGYFRDAEKEIEDQINRLYSKYATDNKVSLQEAKKYLTNNELEEFKRDLEFYVSRAKNPYFRKEYRAYLQALSTRVRVQRLEALKAHVHHAAENAFVKTAQNAEKLFKDVYDTVYYRTAFDAFKSINMGFDVKPYDDHTFNALLSHPWSGADFCEKIWGNTAVFEKQLDEIMTRGMIQGKSNQDLTREIADVTGSSRKNAIRLARTETNYIANQATNDMYTELGVEEYEFLAILDEKTSSICWDLDGEHFPIKDAVPGNNYPPMHPNCRSTSVPYFEDMAEGERTVFVGKDAYKIPKNMTYEEWREKHVKGNTEAQKLLNETRDKEQFAKYKEVLGGDAPKSLAKFQEIKYNDADKWNELKTNYKDRNLSTDERSAIVGYVSPDAYALNEKLRNGDALNDSEKEWVRNLDSALDKMPEFSGITYRSISSFGIDDVESFINSHEIGQIIRYDAYTSSSANGIYDESFPIQYVMQSKHGKDIRKYNESEQEILFKRETQFRITKIDKNMIYMEEI